jgi:hypothetical protein
MAGQYAVVSGSTFAFARIAGVTPATAGSSHGSDGAIALVGNVTQLEAVSAVAAAIINNHGVTTLGFLTRSQVILSSVSAQRSVVRI